MQEEQATIKSAPASTTDSSLVTLQGTFRQQLGKSSARQVRKRGLVPANLLDDGVSKPVSLSPKWLEKIWVSGGVFQLELKEESMVYQVKIHEVQLHPVKRIPIHLDLMVVK